MPHNLRRAAHRKKDLIKMAIYQIIPGARSYGHAVGILLLDRDEPRMPGDVGHAGTFEYPVLYKTVPELDQTIFEGSPRHISAVVESAKYLERNGVKGITSNCGFMIHYQNAAAASVSIPVFLSSLLQIPLICQSLGEHAALGIITASAGMLTDKVLNLSGAPSDYVIHKVGILDCPEFRSTFLDQKGYLDASKIQQEVIQVSKDFVKSHPDIKALLLECSLLPPYSRAVQAVTGLPVFDFMTLVDYFFRATHSRAYTQV